MNSRKLLFIFVALFFVSNSNVLAACRVTAKTNKKSTKIGEPVSFCIQITGPGIKNVSWDITAYALAQNTQIKIIGSKTTANGPQQFQKEFIFTAIKPGDVTIAATPVIIKNAGGIDTLFSQSYQVVFLKQKLPFAVNDIKPIAHSNFSHSKYLQITVVLLCILITILSIVMLLIRANKNKKLHLEAIRQAYLEKIKAIEEQINTGKQTNGHLNEHIYNILDEYLNKTMPGTLVTGAVTANDDAIKQVLQTSNDIRFSYKGNIPGLLEMYLAEVKKIIKNYPVTTS